MAKTTLFASTTTTAARNSVLIHDLLSASTTRSFEYFPPKSDEEAAVLADTLGTLTTLHPSFVSVTYHRGTDESRARTFNLVRTIEEQGTTAMAHLICVGHTRQGMRQILKDYIEAGISNVMALGGDPIAGSDAPSEFAHAIDLVELAREVGTFSIGVGAHPAGHPASPDLASDRKFLAEKLALADFAVTQFFFDVMDWQRLVEELGALSVTKPILPGLMPVTTLSGVARMAQMGAAVPAPLITRLEEANRRGGAAAVRAEGIQAATELAAALLDAGAPGLHFYTLNRSTATRELHAALFDDDGNRR